MLFGEPDRVVERGARPRRRDLRSADRLEAAAQLPAAEDRIRPEQLHLQAAAHQPGVRIDVAVAEPELRRVVDDEAVVDVGVAVGHPAAEGPAVAHPPVHVEVEASVGFLVLTVVFRERPVVVDVRAAGILDHVQAGDRRVADLSRQAWIVGHDDRELVEVSGSPAQVVRPAAELRGAARRRQQRVEQLDEVVGARKSPGPAAARAAARRGSSSVPAAPRIPPRRLDRIARSGRPSRIGSCWSARARSGLARDCRWRRWSSSACR